MRLQQEKLKSVEFRKLSIKLTFSKLPQFFGCKDARRGDNVVTDDAVVRVVRETCNDVDGDDDAGGGWKKFGDDDDGCKKWDDDIDDDGGGSDHIDISYGDHHSAVGFYVFLNADSLFWSEKEKQQRLVGFGIRGLSSLGGIVIRVWEPPGVWETHQALDVVWDGCWERRPVLMAVSESPGMTNHQVRAMNEPPNGFDTKWPSDRPGRWLDW